MDIERCPFGLSDKHIIMGATSVTGVGFGSAEAHNKGAYGRQTLGVGHLIGPYIAAAGSVTLVAGAATVQLPPLSDDETEWVTFVSSTDASSPAAVSCSAVQSDWTIDIVGGGTETVNYMVVKAATA